MFHPEPTANAVRMSELAKVLTKAGHAVSVLTGFPYYRNHVPDPRYAGRYFVNEKWYDVEVIRCHTYVARSNTIFERLKTFNSFTISSVLAGIFRLHGPVDGIIAISPPFFTGFSVLALSAWLKVPYIFDIQDLYPATAVHLGYLKHPLPVKILEAIERFFYRRAAGMIGISEGFASHYRSCGVPERRISVIPNWVDTYEFQFQPFKQCPFSEESPLKLVFFGNHGIAQGLETIVEAARQLEADRRVTFSFVGDGVCKRALQDRVSRLGLKNVSFFPPCPHSDVPTVLRRFDAGIVHLKKNPLYEITVPCKTYEYMALGKPILLGVDGEARLLTEKAGAGMFFEPENSESLARAVKLILKQPEKMAEMSFRGRQAAESSYSKILLGEKYRSFVESIFTLSK